MYSSCVAPKLSLLLKNDRFSEDLSNRFSDYSWNEYPLTADKYMSWIAATPDSEQIINLFMNYEVLGSLHPASRLCLVLLRIRGLASLLHRKYLH